MAFFRRSKSPFAYEVDRFHAPEPGPEWRSLFGQGKSEQSAPPTAKKRDWLAFRKSERSAQAHEAPAEKSTIEEAVKPDQEARSSATKPKPVREEPKAAPRPVKVLMKETEPPKPAAKMPPKPAAKNPPKPPAKTLPKPGMPQPKLQREERGWFGRPKSKGSSQAALEGTRSSDLTIAALGITLGLICALFPWYIFFNQEKFGVRAMKFEGGGVTASGPIALGPQPQRVGAPMNIEDVPVMQLDFFATGTLPDKKGDSDGAAPPGLDEQPFPAEIQQFKLVHIANGRAMIEDDAGLWVVQPGSVLPDSSQVVSIEKRDGNWVLVTSNDHVLELTP